MTLFNWGPTTQWGTSTGAVWTTTAFGGGPLQIRGDTPVVLGFILTWSGLRFQAGEVVENPVVSSITLSLPLLAVGLTPLVRVLRLSWVPQKNPADFSNTALPLTRGEVVLGTFSTPELSVIATTIVEFPISSAHCTLIRATATSATHWQGRLAFVLEHIEFDAGLFVANDGSTPLQAETTQDLFFAGLTGGGEGHLRAVRDHRYGMPAWNTELVRDGDNPGLWVRPWDKDPEDELNRYRPKPGEGTVDDEIGNL